MGAAGSDAMTTDTALPTWTIDPVHSSVEFTLEHMQVATYRTGFRTIEGALQLDPANLARASVTASIPVESIDITNERFYSRLMDDDFFGAKAHPTITFRSTRVEPVDGSRYHVTGDLTIHGITRPVVLDTRYLGGGKSPFSGKTMAAFRAETAIDRRDFGLTWNAQLDTGAAYLGERVHITLLIEALRQD